MGSFFISYSSSRLQSRNNRAFTLVELLVVMSVIIILVSTVTVAVNDSTRQGLDLERETNLRQLQTAIENYKRSNGEYPVGCQGTNTWSGEIDCFDYIEDLRPEFISVLPTDPRPGEADGFVYRTNTDRTVYKIMVRGTVESETVTPAHAMAPCPSTCSNGCDESAPLYENSYALWGGFATAADRATVLAETEAVTCDL